MSDTLDFEFKPKKAMAFNAKYAQRLGWYGRIPEKAILKFPFLALDPMEGSNEDKAKFAQAVHDMQMFLFNDEDDADGKLGGGTRKAMMAAFNPVADDARYYLHHEMRLEAPARKNHSKVLTYKHKDGLDLHRSGKSERKDRGIKFIVLHWSSTKDVKSCYYVLKNRKLSSHFGVGQDVIYQWVDTEFVTYHAGGANAYSIGIDLCTTPKAKYESRMRDLGHDVKVIKNPTDRGDRKCLSLDPKIARATRELILDLCDLYDIPLAVPRGEDGFASEGDYFHGVLGTDVTKRAGFKGIIGHHHVTSKKWDVSPWWAQIFDPLFDE